MMRLTCLFLGIVLSHLLSSPAILAQQVAIDLPTVAEASDYKSTATYAETMEFCRELARQSPRVNLTTFGKSVEERALPLLIIGEPPIKSPADRDANKLTVLIMGNIHAGEVCGKEAGLMLARELASGDAPILEHVNVLIAPIYNPDGNERVSPENRPGQNGPENGVGQRHNAQDLDLNRDHIKLKSPEVRAFARLVTDWNPEIVIDTHTTNGTFHRYALTYDGPRHPAVPAVLIEYVRDTFLPQASQRMEQQSGYRSFYYGDFDESHEKWLTYPDWPRYNTQYVGMRGRIGILSEAYAYLPFRDRVLATKSFLESCLHIAADAKDQIRDVLTKTRRANTQGEGINVPIRSRMVPLAEKFDVLGYVEETDESGDTKATEEEKTYSGVEFFGRSEATASVVKPFAYLVPADKRLVLDNLRAHGIELQELREQLYLDVEQYRVQNIQRADEEYQGQYPMRVDAEAEKTNYELRPGTIVVRTDQPLSALIVNLLEPASQDGLATWNYFDDELREGALYSVLRLPAKVPLLTAALPRSISRREPTIITPRVLYGKRPPNLDGGPISGLRWHSGNKLLHARDGHWYAMDAETGAAELLVNGDDVRKALAEALSLDSQRAYRFWPRMTENLTSDFQWSLLHHAGDLYCVDVQAAAVKRLTHTPAEEELGSFSPDGQWVAYVRDYNLYAQRREGGPEYALSTGGNQIVRYGKADWVYFEEVYNRNWTGYQFSPDSRHIAYMRYDDSHVLDFNVIDHMPPRTVTETERYPKAGDPIPQVRLGIVGVTGGATEWIDLTGYSPDNMIITRYGWLPDSQGLYILVQDRAQQWMDFLRYDLGSKRLVKLFREQSKYWVADPGPLHFLSDGSWLVVSERDGWAHVYEYAADGRSSRQVTTGPWEVRNVQAVDEAAGWLYVSGTRDSHVAQNLYRVHLKNGDVQRLTLEGGTHSTQLSPTNRWYVDANSSLQGPVTTMLRSVDGDWRRVLDSNPVRDRQRYRLTAPEYFEIPLSGGFQMPCLMTRPADFDANKKYPVWIMTYGGPHAPSVTNSWSGRRIAFDQMLAEMGIIALRCDPRSASGQGMQSTWPAYRQLGLVETQDLEQAVDWLASQSYVDAARIGLSGYSYGGYLTAYAMTHSKKFAAGISGAPVTDWRNYDAFYTERYMNTPQENPDGYDVSSVTKAAKDLHGRLLIIHGAMDDNVHLQNALQLAHELQQANKHFELMIYPTFRHGIHHRHYDNLFINFIRRTMLPGDGDES